MEKFKIRIKEHTTRDKHISVSTPHFEIAIDYDDVNHAEVDAATKILVEILEKNWNEELFEKYYDEEILKVWEKNEYGLQSDYESLEDYLEQNGR